MSAIEAPASKRAAASCRRESEAPCREMARMRSGQWYASGLHGVAGAQGGRIPVGGCPHGVFHQRKQNKAVAKFLHDFAEFGIAFLESGRFRAQRGIGNKRRNERAHGTLGVGSGAIAQAACGLGKMPKRPGRVAQYEEGIGDRRFGRARRSAGPGSSRGEYRQRRVRRERCRHVRIRFG